MEVELHYVGHASVLARAGSTSILLDPWFIGSTSQELLHAVPPFSAPSQDALAKVDAIHISHMHTDHFCERTLSRFSKDTPILIGRYRDGYFRGRLVQLGFSNIIEIPSGPEGIRIGDWRVSSFSTGTSFPYDSSVVLTAGGESYVFDNDARFSARHYFWIKQFFPNVVGACVGYSDVFPYPGTYDFSENIDVPGVTTKQISDVIEEESWGRIEYICSALRPRWVFPYANGLRFRHEDLLHFNDLICRPDGIKKRALGETVPVSVLPGERLGPIIPHPPWKYEEPVVEVLPRPESDTTVSYIAQRAAEFRELYRVLLERESRTWTVPMTVRAEVRKNKEEPFCVDFHFDGTRVLLADSTIPDLRIIYEPESLKKLLDGEWGFSEIHMSYRCKILPRRVVALQIGAHRWGLSR